MAKCVKSPLHHRVRYYPKRLFWPPPYPSGDHGGSGPIHGHFDELHRKYYDIGRAFKYSGDARFWSTYPSTHKEYRPLPKPPPPNSLYHKYGGLIARLELVDALVCFTYGIWNKEYGRKACIADTWQTAQAFLSWCKSKWQTSDTVGNRETAFQGLM
jgi:hypothetical protein